MKWPDVTALLINWVGVLTLCGLFTYCNCVLIK